MTGRAHRGAVERELPGIADKNVFLESEPRDSTAAIGLAARLRPALVPAASIAGLVLLWYLGAVIADDPRRLPAPGAVLHAIALYTASGELPYHLGVTLLRMEEREHRNTFTPAFMEGMQEAFALIARTDACKVVVLTGHDPGERRAIRVPAG